MKKIYVKPKTETVVYHMQPMMNGSTIDEGQEYGGTTVLSRSGSDSFWDDEEQLLVEYIVSNQQKCGSAVRALPHFIAIGGICL